MIRYSYSLMLFLTLCFIAFIFAGRGASFNIVDLKISFSAILGLIPWIIFAKSCNFNFISRSQINILITFLAFCFFIYSLFSLFYTPSPKYGIDKTFNLFVFFINGMLLISILNKEEFKRILKLIIFIVFPLACIYVLLNLKTGFQSRIGLFGAGSITTGRMFSFSCIIVSYFWITEKKKIYFLFFILFLLSTFFSGSRGNFIFTIIAILFPLIFINPKLFIKILLSFAGVAYIIINFELYEKIPFFYRYSLLTQGGGESIEVRFYAYRLSFSIFKENLIFGVGSGGYSFYSLKYDGFDYPHNIFLEIASELGEIGIILFFSILILTFISSLKNYLILALLIFYILVSSGSGDLYDARILFILFFLRYLLKGN
ncbi:hypothetical protein AFK20_00760 [Enhydrobacter aerosaccus]|uniref:O-antigen ligase-related domain-containing protein n=1 Tax=Enhydrobacter aerosaccus TaxID=225324 RepID=A0ABR5INM9_9HYPH|nr:O-antigen ligase family protein [Enhydrobacter aerosaccus]KND22682.1 hypothetical protein AFK20_00760 [Enhydrobacter aerosaccus]